MQAVTADDSSMLKVLGLTGLYRLERFQVLGFSASDEQGTVIPLNRKP